MKTTIAILTALTAALSLASAQAADTPEPPPARVTTPTPAAAAAEKLASARALIANKQWAAAVGELQRVNDASSADWNNLLAYSLRKSKTPDLAAAQQYYDAALRIDPQHRNALAYSGELFLMKGELDQAQARLATLANVCAGPCDQHAELKGAIDKYTAAGNRYIATW